ncbi:MAG TPA: hypothetical protein DCL77_20480 [Prolixibacteraceae bacterium]|jgi:hypothetical protein|nr:hypothetical protein [Prolixibacteraceae bacterium]
MDPIKIEYEKLATKIRLNLPIRALPTKELVAKIQVEHPELTLNSIFYIKDIINTGDLSGILCIIGGTGINSLVCSLTHIEIVPTEPLLTEIRKYQKERTKRVDIQYKQMGN